MDLAIKARQSDFRAPNLKKRKYHYNPSLLVPDILGLVTPESLCHLFRMVSSAELGLWSEFHEGFRQELKFWHRHRQVSYIRCSRASSTHPLTEHLRARGQGWKTPQKPSPLWMDWHMEGKGHRCPCSGTSTSVSLGDRLLCKFMLEQFSH